MATYNCSSVDAGVNQSPQGHVDPADLSQIAQSVPPKKDPEIVLVNIPSGNVTFG